MSFSLFAYFTATSSPLIDVSLASWFSSAAFGVNLPFPIYGCNR
jgi:hypothetical protein